MNNAKAVIYARVSTDKQSHDSQLSELRQYCTHRNWSGVTEIIDSISGSKSSREGLDRLMGLVRIGKVDRVICYKLDRLGRSLAHLAQLIGEFTSNNVALIVPSQGIDTSANNPAASLQLNILCAVAQFEREIIRERVNAGLSAAKKRGVVLGRPSTLDQHREKVMELKQRGEGIRSISRITGLPLSSVHKITRNNSCE